MIKFTIRLPANRSLKGKRMVVKSLCQKIRNEFNVSVAEISHLDDTKIADIGISFVSNSLSVIQQIISHILRFLQERAGDYVLLEFQQDVMTVF